MNPRADRLVTRLIADGLFPIHERLKRHHSLALRRELEISQWWSADAIRDRQLVVLRNFLEHAGRHVPYYRQVFADAAFNAAALSDAAQLSQLPLLTKPLIRSQANLLVADDAVGLKRLNTGGSTGEPLIFFVDRGRVSHDVAAKWRATRWWDVDIGDREIVLWGSPIELGGQDLIKGWRDRLFRTRLLPAFQMSAQQMDGHLDTIESFRPTMLFGYASALALLASHAARRGRELQSLGIRVAFATGEMLYPNQRAAITAAFGCPVANGYGSRDAGFIAHECPSGGLHVTAEHILVELLDAQGLAVRPGETGEVVVTHMATRGFPFIRYRTGDLAALSTAPCACGRGLPLLATVHGRSTDLIRTADGAVMHALALIYEVRDKPGIRSFKFIQAEDYSIELLLVTDADYTSDTGQRIRVGLMARLGPDAVLTIRQVAEIPAEKSGKYRYVVSRAA